MTQILVWDAHHDTIFIDATELLDAYYEMFKLALEGSYYADLEEDLIADVENEPGDKRTIMKNLFDKAKNGDKMAAKSLIKMRQHWESESCYLAQLVKPSNQKNQADIIASSL